MHLDSRVLSTCLSSLVSDFEINLRPIGNFSSSLVFANSFLASHGLLSVTIIDGGRSGEDQNFQ